MDNAPEWLTFISVVLAAAVRSGTPIAFAAIGETLTERSGIINLGIEGMMLCGALTGVAVQVETGNVVLALFCAGLAAAMLAAVHAVICIGLSGNQIVSGIALTILGTGVAGFLGRRYVGVQVTGIDVFRIPYLSEIPFVGRVLFRHDPLVYLSILFAVAMWFLLWRTRFGLQVRAVGEDPHASYAQGVPVRWVRVVAVLIGGFLAGIGGAHLSLAYTHVWAERMTAGQGWIAVGLVIVAGWHPIRALLVAYAFGALAALHPHLQAAGISVSPYLIATLPYVFAIVALTLATRTYAKSGHGLPAALAKEFYSEDR